jgi:hypothetical protein
MATTPLRIVLRENVLALLARETPLPRGQSGVSRLKRLGIAQGNAQRVLEGKTSIGLDLLEQLSAIFKVAPWQLLVEGLDVRAPPGLTVDHTAWPFPMVERRAYYAMTDIDRAFVQGAMNNAISQRAPAATPADTGNASIRKAQAMKDRKAARTRGTAAGPAEAPPASAPAAKTPKSSHR